MTKKLNLRVLIGAALVGCASCSFGAESTGIKLTPKGPKLTPTKMGLGAEKEIHEFYNVRIRNMQDEPLGRIKDLGIDLVNGRIVEVLVVADGSLDEGKKVVAVPPRALLADGTNQVYRLNVSQETFKAAPTIDLKEWTDAGRSERVAAAYRHFGQEPYFLEVGDTASKTADRPLVSLGYVERCTKIIDLPVGNFQGEKFGKVWSMTLDIPNGLIRTVVVMKPGNFQTKSIIPATALAFNAKRDGLLLDDTKMEYAEEPRYVFTQTAFGNDAYSKEQTAKTPRTNARLEQGDSYHDIDQTVLINKNIRAAKLHSSTVEVGTNDGRVTLRGWVDSQEKKNQIGAIAIAASRLELVDNQLIVGPEGTPPPPAAKKSK